MAREFELIRWIRERTRTQGQDSGVVRLGIGDDCAILDSPADGRGWLMTTDMLIDGRHFRLADGLHPPEHVGRKAMAVNVSDIAAMAGDPVAALVSIALPRNGYDAVARGLTRGLRAEADRFGVAIAGGDTNLWKGPLVVNVTMIGLEPAGGAITRSGAKPGDIIAVSGPLGGSLPSGRHMRPQPRVQEARELLQTLGQDLHAMIDLSDGLGGDIRHILTESGNLGARLNAASIPLHDDIRAHFSEEMATDPAAALRHALSDGEDFELCFCVARRAAKWLPNWATPIGTVTDSGQLTIEWNDGRETLWLTGGFDHFRSTGD